MIPGLPGYVPIRDRGNPLWQRTDGKYMPEWWEVEPEKKLDEKEIEKGMIEIDTSFGYEKLNPVALVPPQERPAPEPIPVSNLRYFPNHLAYRSASPITQSPSAIIDASNLGALTGKDVDMVFIIRMPVESDSPDSLAGVDSVTRHWDGVQLGISRIRVE
ncbi:hypothetical protein M231_01312 [Tremella mesenterica]|uniref:Uncharacterized protein n=1 Tax=Tremella mesenterica TaxID=5217 RepID=A0A4V1M4S7_TREME|nr:hypothetical protein M231_01312 [Tremella mesenterica]